MEIAAIPIGILVAFIIYLVRHRRFVRNFPPYQRRRELVSTIVAMKRQGKTYADRLAYLQQQGLCQDVADVLLGEAEKVGTS